MNYTFNATTECDDVITMTGGGEKWHDQAELFYRFLLAQGYVLRRGALSEYFDDLDSSYKLVDAPKES